MQRGFLLLSTLLSLYVSGFAYATAAPPAPAGEKPVAHIALLLPLTSKVFGTAAAAVRQGFLAAANLENKGLPVRVYGSADESKDIVTLYRQAIANGARAVVGPLTRSGVSILAEEQNIPVPTLTLNMMDDQPARPIYSFGMNAEAEARQIAQLAKQQGLHQAIVITAGGQLAQRLQLAFEEEWTRSGGKILSEIEFGNDPEVLSEIADLPDVAAFLAADADQARLIRPYLPNKLPTYATSQIFAGNSDTLINYDLNGIQFVDMPWLLQPDHPAVMTYPRAIPPLSADLERFYALGIDAYRLIQLMVANKIDSAMPLDGVSGNIQLRGHTFQRVALPAIFQQGHAQLPGAAPVPAVQFFPVAKSGIPEIGKPEVIIPAASKPEASKPELKKPEVKKP